MLPEDLLIEDAQRRFGSHEEAVFLHSIPVRRTLPVQRGEDLRFELFEGSFVRL